MPESSKTVKREYFLIVLFLAVVAIVVAVYGWTIIGSAGSDLNQNKQGASTYCPTVYDPVCAYNKSMNQLQQFNNSCYAEAAGYKNYYKGTCAQFIADIASGSIIAK